MTGIPGKSERFNEALFMGGLSLLCVSFSVFRCLYAGSRRFLFLNWNLFLAFVPWGLTTLSAVNSKIQKSKIALAVLFFFWLIFFPNAPYILTDIFHLKSRSSMPVWFDALLILSFAWTGLLFGFLSLWDIERILEKTMKRRCVTLVSAILLFAGSFGVYLGRYLRWNSWNLITEPFPLLSDIGDSVINPAEHPRAWGLTLFMGIFLNMLYWSFRLIKRRPLSGGQHAA
ncbi:MAG: DUF1361 domain-containing protein [Treponema sp.]|jgi:uncharacterized membrane protein|nr:DUF1361 domain-containing protein [Treponema sp.]